MASNWLQNGFPNRTDSSISFNDGTRRFTINPSGASFDYFIAGVKYTVSSSDVLNVNYVDITDTEGLWTFYYDGSTLTSQHNPTDAQLETIILSKAWIAFVYWDATNNVGTLLEERHGIEMSSYTHRELHFTVGTTFFDGLALGDFVISDGADDEDAQFSIATGQIFDEDIKHIINAINKTTGVDIWYRSNSNWRKDTQTGFKVLTQDGTSATRLSYDNAGTRTEVTDSKFVLYHAFAWNAVDLNPIMIMGQAEYSTAKLARIGATTEINNLLLAALPSKEMKAIATVIFQTKDTYANNVNAKVVQTDEGDDYVDWRTAEVSSSAAAGEHGLLAGLSDDDHTQYILHSLADAASDFLVASGADTFVKKTLAETGAILESDIDHGNLQGLDTGADHSYIDQDVTTSGNPQFATVELGHATDTTLTRIGAGVVAIEGNNIVLVSNSVDVLNDVDTVTASPSTNDVLKWDGTNWIPGTAGDTGEFTFAIYSFSDALVVVQIGGGEWKAIDAVTFTIVYTYGPATGANITMSSDDVDLTLWAVNPLVLPSDYTSDTNASAMNYPDTVNNYIKFALSADKNGANDTDNEYVYFRNKKYYGFSATTGQLDSTETLALSGSGFVTASVNNLDTAAHTQTPTGTQYLHFLWPNRISPSNAGTTMFEINGFPTAFTNNGTFTFDNGVGTGYQETYIDYEAPFGYDAALTFEVKADA